MVIEASICIIDDGTCLVYASIDVGKSAENEQFGVHFGALVYRIDPAKREVLSTHITVPEHPK